ncbi:MAG: hypothetical protein H6Q68_522 [Firmicutes bacterium]|nr:hypothetical protein [Bacillota bacterium]
MEYEWSGRLSLGTEYKVLNQPADMIVDVIGVDNDNGYVTLQSNTMFSVELFVGGVQVAILPAFAV